MIQIEEVLKVVEHLSEILFKMNTDLHQTAKVIVEKLKQNPGSIKENPFKGWFHDFINKLNQVIKLDPQDMISNKKNEESKVGEPALLKFVKGYLEINEAVKQQIVHNLKLLGTQALGLQIEPENYFLKSQKPVKAVKKFTIQEYITLKIQALDKELADHEKINQVLETGIEIKLREAIDKILGNKPPPKIDLKTILYSEKLCLTNNQE